MNDTLGWVDHRKSMPSFAMRHLELSVKTGPNNPGSRYRLGMAYLASGDLPKAKKALETALSMKSDFDGAKTRERRSPRSGDR